MNKINFENLPSTNTPINAENLNQLQTNVENALTENVTNENNTSTSKSYSCKYINDNYVKGNSWKLPQFKSLTVTANTEKSVTFNVKAPSINWNYDIYKISMDLGEANYLTIKDVYVAIGINDFGSYQAKVVTQNIITGNDAIGTLTITNNGDNTATIKFKPTTTSKLKIKIEPYAVYL